MDGIVWLKLLLQTLKGMRGNYGKPKRDTVSGHSYSEWTFTQLVDSPWTVSGHSHGIIILKVLLNVLLY